MAKPNKKGPTKTIDIFCSACQTKLMRYRKGGKGSLVKCFKERIAADFTNGDLKCHQCGQLFGRDTLIRGTPAIKIIGGKVTTK